MFKHGNKRIHLVCGAAALIVGCADQGDSSECTGAKCDNLDPIATGCAAALRDFSGGLFGEDLIAELDDPFARAVLQASEDECPMTFAEVMAALEANDCAGGVETRLVSEEAQVVGRHADNDTAEQVSGYRAVVSKSCNGRDSNELLFSQFGLGAGSEAPDDFEVMAFDQTAGVYNYYKLHPVPTDDFGEPVEGAEPVFAFYGNSKNFIDHGAGDAIAVPAVAGSEFTTNTSERDCARCHTGGGLIMKELNSPWVHWHETSGDLPGEKAVMDANPVYGRLTTGADMQFSIVQDGNRRWNTTRIDHVISTRANCDDSGACSLPTADLLRPLFCTVEVNLGTGGSGLRDRAVIDPELGRFGLRGSDHYAGVIEEIQQQVLLGIEGFDDPLFKQVASSLAGVRDTIRGSAFIERSHADQDYVKQLAAGVIDAAFAKDVRAVDFTRHVFSPDRCGLLALAPTIEFEADVTDASQLTKDRLPADMPELIRAGFQAALADATPGTPAGELLANLSDDADPA